MGLFPLLGALFGCDVCVIFALVKMPIKSNRYKLQSDVSSIIVALF